MTRTADLKQKLQEATRKHNDLNILVDALRSGTDTESMMLLARLRLGISVEDLVKSLRNDTALTNITDSLPGSGLKESSGTSETTSSLT